MDYLKEFPKPSAHFRGASFWAWNCGLKKEELLRQIEVFQKMGLGGFTMHCRTGLGTPYLGEEFLEVVKACVEKAKALGMEACLYDEDRWPSGAAGGEVTKEPKYRARYLAFSPFPKEEAAADRANLPASSAQNSFQANGTLLARYEISLSQGALSAYRRLKEGEEGETVWYAYLEVSAPSSWYNNQAYVDTLNPEAIRRFLETTHETYWGAVGEEFGKTVPSIFTDEPQFVHKGTLGRAEEKKPIVLPYTDDFDESFQKAYGQSFLDVLPEVVWELPKGKRSLARYRYHDHIAQRFCEAFSNTISQWCEKHNLALTGHMMEEPTLQSQTAAISEAMRHYRGFQIPGIDMLCDWREYNTAKQAQSACHQFGRNQMTSELYGVTNWDFDFRRHKLQGDWQAALGVTHRVHHLSWVSMEGEAKRDYPASISFQSPWHEKYALLEDHYARVNTALRSGKPKVRVGVIHPIESFWLWFGPKEQTAAVREKLDRQFSQVTDWLLFGLIDFDFISEGLLKDMEKGPKDGRFHAGEMAYDAVVVPGCVTLRGETLERLKAFRGQGGKVVFLGDLPSHIDALPSQEGKKLAENCVAVPFEQTALLDALQEFRLIDLKDENGVRTGEYLSQTRENGEELLLFLANGRAIKGEDIPKARTLTLEIAGEYQPLLLNTFTGEQKPIAASYRGGKTEIPWTCWGQDSLLLRLKKGPAAPWEEVAGQENCWEEAAVLGEVRGYETQEPNVLLLDQAEFSVDGGPLHTREELLRADTLVREQLGYPADGGDVAQPWTVPEEPYRHVVALRFTVESEQRLENVKLALEQAGISEIFWDGERVEPRPEGWYTDPCLTVMPLPLVEKGSHVLEIRVPYRQRSSLEWCYLLGDFGVRVTGSRAVLTASPKAIGFGSLTSQGFPFYGGNFTYRMEVEAEEGEYALSAAKFRAPLLSVRVDGEEKGEIAFAPYRVLLGRLSAGSHRIELTAYGSRVNTFGQVHLTDEELTWFGPDSWRTKGESFSYEYQLKRTGVLAAPRLYKKVEE